jgi:hypothetical protein
VSQYIELPTGNAIGREDLTRTDPGETADALVRVVPTHTGLSLQCLSNELIALLRGSARFLQIDGRITAAGAEGRVSSAASAWDVSSCGGSYGSLSTRGVVQRGKRPASRIVPLPREIPTITTQDFGYDSSEAQKDMGGWTTARHTPNDLTLCRPCWLRTIEPAFH